MNVKPDWTNAANLQAGFCSSRCEVSNGILYFELYSKQLDRNAFLPQNLQLVFTRHTPPLLKVSTCTNTLCSTRAYKTAVCGQITTQKSPVNHAINQSSRQVIIQINLYLCGTSLQQRLSHDTFQFDLVQTILMFFLVFLSFISRFWFKWTLDVIAWTWCVETMSVSHLLWGHRRLGFKSYLPTIRQFVYVVFFFSNASIRNKHPNAHNALEPWPLQHADMSLQLCTLNTPSNSFTVNFAFLEVHL